MRRVSTLGDVGRFWLRRLAFEKAHELRQRHAETYKASVPSALEYYAPLIVGVAGGPLATAQLDQLVNNMIGNSWHLAIGSVLTFVGAFFMLGNVLRKNAPGLGLSALVRRALVPGCMLVVFMVVMAGTVWALQARPEELGAPLAPLVVWTGLSLFQGVFAGLIAQGSSGTRDPRG